MSGFYVVEPEVAGGWGENIEFFRVLGRPVKVKKLHYEFDAWPGDALLTSSPCYIGTANLAQSIEMSKLSGIRFNQVEISKSAQFEEKYSMQQLPDFLWFQICGSAGADDFALTPDLQLVVSERALAILECSGITNARIEPFRLN